MGLLLPMNIEKQKTVLLSFVFNKSNDILFQKSMPTLLAVCGRMVTYISHFVCQTVVVPEFFCNEHCRGKCTGGGTWPKMNIILGSGVNSA